MNLPNPALNLSRARSYASAAHDDWTSFKTHIDFLPSSLNCGLDSGETVCRRFPTCVQSSQVLAAAASLILEGREASS
jgi:hypothetical protein